MKMPGANQIEA